MENVNKYAELEPLISLLREIEIDEYHEVREYEQEPGEAKIKTSLDSAIAETEDDEKSFKLFSTGLILCYRLTPFLERWCQRLGINIFELQNTKMEFHLTKTKVSLKIVVEDEVTV